MKGASPEVQEVLMLRQQSAKSSVKKYQAMAGTKVQMSPVALMMIHNPATIAIGDSEEMKRAIKMLDEVKESIMNALHF